MLIGWDVGVLIYLAAAAVMMARCASVAAMKKNAAAQDEGAFAILILTVAPRWRASARSSPSWRASSAPAPDYGLYVALAIVTVVLSWTFTHTIFALHYAHEFYGEGTAQERPATFPAMAQPDYWDFIYFAFVIGMTFQVSDVAVTNKSIRRIVVAHGALSFFFTAAIIAVTVNIAANVIQKSNLDGTMTATIQIAPVPARRAGAWSPSSAQRLKTAPSILLVIAGIALALIPGLPPVELAPELVLLVLLPPLIYSAGVSMSWREFRFNLRPITLLAFGCVVFTTCAVAAAMHYLLGWQWGVGFRARRHRRAAGRRGAARHRAAARPAAPAARGAGGRRPRQRRHRADSLSLRGRGDRHRARSRCAQAAGTFGLIVVGEIIYGIGVGWLSLRLRQWAQQSARRDHAVADDAVSRLLDPRASRRLRRAGDRRRRTLRELERAAADLRRRRGCRASSSGT